jgi:hypothetical protein
MTTHTESRIYKQLPFINQSIVEFAQSMHPTHLITLRTNYNYCVPLSYGADKINYFHAQLDRQLLGPRWSKQPSHLRSHSISVPEGRVGNGRDTFSDLHYHLLTCLAPDPKLILDLAGLQALTRQLWHKCVPSGDSDVRPVYNAAGIASYCVKHFYSTDCIGMLHYCVN